MRYRLTVSHKTSHAQVLTPPNLAERLIGMVSCAGEDWIELGSGNGRIADACLRDTSPASYIGIEIDKAMIRQCARQEGLVYHHANVLDPDAIDALLGARLFSRAAGNPPYGIATLPIRAQERLESLCPGLPLIKEWGQLDLYFVLESLARLKRPGEAAFIVGAPLAEDDRLEAFRKNLISAASEVECYELAPAIFKGDIEVQSYMLIARFGRVRAGKCKVTVGRMRGANLAITEQRTVAPESAHARLDIAHHEFMDFDSKVRNMRNCATLRDLDAAIVRGSRTKGQFVELGMPHFHTSDFPQRGRELRFGEHVKNEFQLAQCGDILIPRVGSRCLDRHAIVVDGSRPYTESVYRLRLPHKNRDRVLNWISSDSGTMWRQGVAKGSCAKHLTVSTLLDMPVPA